LGLKPKPGDGNRVCQLIQFVGKENRKKGGPIWSGAGKKIREQSSREFSTGKGRTGGKNPKNDQAKIFHGTQAKLSSRKGGS